MDEQQQLEDYIEALKRFTAAHPQIAVMVTPAEMMSIVGGLQLALRHPNFNGPSADICRKFICSFQETMLEEEPAISTIIDKGFNSEFDT